MDNTRGSSPSKSGMHHGESPPEQLLDTFKKAALSITTLYKMATAAESKARSTGYQECLEELLVFLDKRSIGHSEGEGSKIRKWIAERFEGREGIQSVESEDEVEKNDALPPQEPSTQSASSDEVHMNSDPPSGSSETARSPTVTTPTPTPSTIGEGGGGGQLQHQQQAQQAQQSQSQRHSQSQPHSHSHRISVPTQDTFNFQSTVSYPLGQDADLNMDNLDLSDTRASEAAAAAASRYTTGPVSRTRTNRSGPRGRGRDQVNRVSAGQKRKLNIAELFDIGSLGNNPFGPSGNKRRHT